MVVKIPPKTTNFENHNQTSLQNTELETILAKRTVPKLSHIQQIIQYTYFMIFGILKVIIGGIFVFIAFSLFLIACTLWKAIGSPEHFRRHLQSLWTYLSRIIMFFFGIVSITFKGKPCPESRFLVSNHVSFFDWIITFYITESLRIIN